MSGISKISKGKFHPVKSADEVDGVPLSAEQFSRVKKLGNVFVLRPFFYGLIFFIFSLLIADAITASITDGTIDSTYKYAWSNNAGWINFGAANGNIHITDSGITGYAWNEIYGWINMAPANSGVTISTSGALSGSAWGESVGWIDFSGVSIGCSSGKFSGNATGDTVGTLTFNCTNCNVITDYRPLNCRGGGPPPPPPPPPLPECGNGLCSGNETCATCASDCGACPFFCGDNSCNGNETCGTCEVDCGECLPSCGDSSCNGNETCGTCEVDCGECPSPCGNGTCDAGETCNACPIDCGECPPLCGDSSCNGQETCQTCSTDCGECPFFCGDNSCNGNETCGTCASDCGECIIPQPPSCGNRNCETGEACGNCPEDCGVCPGGPPPSTCGNGACDAGESCNTCSEDCGQCKPFFTPACGDGSCGITENCYTCSEDCGQCEPIPTPIPGIVIPPVVPPAIREIIETPIGSATTKVIATTGAVTTVAVTAFAFPFSFLELFLLPLRLTGILLIAFGLKKRNPPWGVVYDSVTKQPLDPAYIALFDSSGKEISSAITDLDGRYGFLAELGFYKLSANKTNYLFPSQKLAGKTNDELYNNLYFGEQTEVKKDRIIIKNIPLDPLKFDWNEFAKQDKRLTRFYSKWDAFFRKISDAVYYIGFAVAVIAFFAAPYPYNLIILGLYVFLLVLRILGLKPRPFGFAADKAEGYPLSFAILRIVSADSGREITHKITDKYGRYFCLVPKGKYYVKIEKKNNDGSYSLVHTSAVINVLKTGIIKERFKI